MKEKYPNPRPTQSQVDAIKFHCRNTSTPIPELEYMTQGQAGKWYREHKERLEKPRVISKITVTTFANGSVDVTHHRR